MIFDAKEKGRGVSVFSLSESLLEGGNAVKIVLKAPEKPQTSCFEPSTPVKEGRSWRVSSSRVLYRKNSTVYVVMFSNFTVLPLCSVGNSM